MPENSTTHQPSPALPALLAAHLGPWAKHARCTGTDPDIFFPPKTSPGTQAKRICQRCPVRQDCLDYAMQAGEKHGIWGGLNEKQRHSLQRRQTRTRSRKGDGAA